MQTHKSAVGQSTSTPNQDDNNHEDLLNSEGPAKEVEDKSTSPLIVKHSSLYNSLQTKNESISVGKGSILNEDIRQ